MQIFFDYQIFSAQRYGGISRYFVRLSEQLLELGADADVIVPIHQNKYLKELPAHRVHGLGIPRFPPRSGRLIRLINQHFCPFLSRNLKADIIHETYYSPRPTIISGHTARVLTVYDMIHEKYAKEFAVGDKTTHFKKIAIQRSGHIICISYSTKKDLCELFDVPPERVTVVHLGVDFFENDVDSNFLQFEKPFVLYVGGRRGYKNFENFIRAFALNKNLSNELMIIAFGGGPFKRSETELIRSVGLGVDAVHQVDGDDTVLGALYKKASAFVYPSLYEGFGLPPLEAMAHGCPVASSNTSSMPEVIGGAGEYFEPTDIEAMANALEKVVFDSSRRQELIKAGNQRIKQFSWRRCAEETRDVYSAVIEETST